jgi:hypothetical protein
LQIRDKEMTSLVASQARTQTRTLLRFHENENYGWADAGHVLGQQLGRIGNEKGKGKLGRLGRLQGFGLKPKTGKTFLLFTNTFILPKLFESNSNLYYK